MTSQPQCDLIMRGGITSGVVYPGALVELAKHWRFRNIGGASAGAIAAGLAAAAQHGVNTRAADSTFDPFASVVAKVPAELGGTGGDSGLQRLASPVQGLGPLMQMAIGFMKVDKKKAFCVKVFSALWAVKWSTLLWIASWLAPAHLVCLFLGPWAATTVGLVFVGVTIGGLVWWLLHKIHNNGFAVCSGIKLGPTCEDVAEMRKRGALSEWLHALLQEAAGLNPTEILTVGHLWHGKRGASPTFGPWHSERDVDLVLTTTNLSQRLAHTFPFLEKPQSYLYFTEADLKRVLPSPVVRHLIDKANQDWTVQGDGVSFYRLPPVKDLPVLLGVRMSLSFPGLFSAVRLFEAPARDIGMTNVDDLRPCWFSDGGITSNFPVTAFDTVLPTRPTFCINLADAQPEDNEADLRSKTVSRVHRPLGNSDAVRAPHQKEPTNILGFIGAIVNTAREAEENELMTAPGHRDRIATVKLIEGEGGLNLQMDAITITSLSQSGQEAGQQLTDQYKTGGAAGTAWDNHRWIRLRTALAGIEGLLVQFHRGWQHQAGSPESYPNLLQSHGAGQSYRVGNDAEVKKAQAHANAIAKLAHDLANAATSRPSQSVFNGHRRLPDDVDALTRTNAAPRPAMGYRLRMVGRDPLSW